ncbi:radical SAM protein [Streptomyces tendae]|uniref:radical SAM protein n=1 Tax=Streptomyces tendae TaxID=1932 RepID=UPI00364F65DE
MSPRTCCVLYVSGCPLRCLYCANPDAWHIRDGREVTVDEMMRKIGEYRGFVTPAEEEVTISGQECQLQPAFTAVVLRRSEEGGLHTALDTSGLTWPQGRRRPHRGHRPRAAGHQVLRRPRLLRTGWRRPHLILEFVRRLARVSLMGWSVDRMCLSD